MRDQGIPGNPLPVHKRIDHDGACTYYNALTGEE